MAQRRHHYERAFEEFLRSRRIPYVAVDEARKTLLPEGAFAPASSVESDGPARGALKSFDFVIYGQPGGNLLVDIKGRRVSPRRSGDRWRPGRLESWATADDVESLEAWERLFGPDFAAALVFVYWCDAQPPDALFQEVVEFHGAWYALRVVMLDQYRAHMKVRSPRWRTVDVPSSAFEKISRPFAPSPPGGPDRARRGDRDLAAAWMDAGPELPALAPILSDGYDHS